MPPYPQVLKRGFSQPRTASCYTVFELPWWLNGKESVCNAGDVRSVLGFRRSPGGGNGTPLQYSCLGNPMDRGAWWATVHGVTKESEKTPQLSHHVSIYY